MNHCRAGLTSLCKEYDAMRERQLRMKKLIMITGIIILFSCNREYVNPVKSSFYKTKEERINSLKNFFHPRSEIKDAEFEIYDVNMNNCSIPGPTDRDYRIAVIMDTVYLDKWKDENMHRAVKPFNYEWGIELIKNNPAYNISTLPEAYKTDGREMYIFKKEGIIFIRIIQR